MFKTTSLVLLSLVGLCISKKPSCYPNLENYPWIYVPNSDQPYSDVWFMIDYNERTWQDSLAFCNSLGKGHHIASIFNDDETQATMKLHDNDAWIGGISDKVNWAWAYGFDDNYDPIESTDYTNWEEGQPAYGDYGIYYIRSDLKTGEWDDKGNPDREEYVVCMLRCDNA